MHLCLYWEGRVGGNDLRRCDGAVHGRIRIKVGPMIVAREDEDEDEHS
jgi:hypothetical protein